MTTTAHRGVDRRLAWFLGGSVVLGSVATALLARIPTTPEVLPLVALPISYVPALLAVLLVRTDPDPAERRAFRRVLTLWRVAPRWYLAALVVGPAVHLAGVGPATAWGGLLPVHLGMLALLPLFLLTNLGEEIGWRGYALPRLQRHVTPLTASLVLGGCWAAFHVVALAQNPDRPWAYVAVGSVVLVAMSVVMTWLFNRTGSVLLVAVCHAVYDVVAIGVVPLAGTTVPLLAFALSAAALCVVAVALVAVTGPQLGRRARSSRGRRARARAASVTGSPGRP